MYAGRRVIAVHETHLEVMIVIIVVAIEEEENTDNVRM